MDDFTGVNFCTASAELQSLIREGVMLQLSGERIDEQAAQRARHLIMTTQVQFLINSQS